MKSLQTYTKEAISEGLFDVDTKAMDDEITSASITGDIKKYIKDKDDPLATALYIIDKDILTIRPTENGKYSEYSVAHITQPILEILLSYIKDNKLKGINIENRFAKITTDNNLLDNLTVKFRENLEIDAPRKMSLKNTRFISTEDRSQLTWHIRSKNYDIEPTIEKVIALEINIYDPSILSLNIDPRIYKDVRTIFISYADAETAKQRVKDNKPRLTSENLYDVVGLQVNKSINRKLELIELRWTTAEHGWSMKHFGYSFWRVSPGSNMWGRTMLKK